MPGELSTAEQVLAELIKLGNPGIKAIYIRHGVKEPFYGVKIEDMKKLQKKIKGDRHAIAMGLFKSGIGDAQYFAGLMANGERMTEKDLQYWVENAQSHVVGEYSVPWVASEHPDGFSIGLKWIDDKQAAIASAGWCTLAGIVSTKTDDKLDLAAIRKLMQRVQRQIKAAPDRVRYCMNGFIISVGSYIKELSSEASAVGEKIGKVDVNMNGSSCRVTYAPDYIKR